MILVAKIVMCTDSSGTTATYYACSGAGWATSATDTPASTFIQPRIVSAGGYTREMFSGDALFGAVRASFGSLELSNADGSLDAWRTYGFDGRAITLYVGDEGDAFPSAFTKVAETQMLSVDVTMTRVVVVLRDPMQALEKPVARSFFAGSGGLEGSSTIAGQPKPRSIGTTYFCPLTLVDSANQIYIAGTDASSSSGLIVYDGGAAVTQGANYPDTATLLSTAPAAGQARVYVGGPTYVRFQTAPSFEPTLTRLPSIGGGTVMGSLATECGLTLHGTYTTGPTMGVYVDDAQTTYFEIMARESLQAPRWFGIDKDGKFVVRLVADPTGGPSVASIYQHDILTIDRTTPDGARVPVWRVVARGDRNWAKEKKWLSASASNGSRQDFQSAAKSEDSTVLTKHPTARELSIEIGNDPSTTASDHLSLHKYDRDLFRVRVQMSTDWSGLDVGDIVTLYHPRMSLSAGRMLLIVGVALDFATWTQEFSLWG